MFDFNFIDNFDDHIKLSIPNYEDMEKTVVKLSEYFVAKDSNVYDLGCSTGRMIKKYHEEPRAHYFGYDNSNLIPRKHERINFKYCDLATAEIQNASFITSIFTLQFLSKKTRQLVLEKISNGLNKNGALIVAEKVYSNTSKMQDIMNSLFYEFKNKSFTGDEILKKERELRTNMRIKTHKQLYGELKLIGEPEIIWKSYNFLAYIVIKE